MLVVNLWLFRCADRQWGIANMSLLLKIHDLNQCLTTICAVEADIFDNSLKGLFRKKDYSGNAGVLEVAIRKLDSIMVWLCAYETGTEELDRVVADSLDYAIDLLDSTQQLLLINNKLASKALGEAYAMRDYNVDCEKFRRLQDDYVSSGATLNAAYKLYAYEISLLEDPEMLGFFSKTKTFEQEMAEYDAEAKALGKKYPPEQMFGGVDILKQMELQKLIIGETIQICQKRVECCKRHGKVTEQRKWEESIENARALIG